MHDVIETYAICHPLQSKWEVLIGKNPPKKKTLIFNSDETISRRYYRLNLLYDVLHSNKKSSKVYPSLTSFSALKCKKSIYPLFISCKPKQQDDK